MNVMENMEKENQSKKMKQYMNQLILPEKIINFLKNCYDFAKKDLGLIKNRYQFSEHLMNRNPYYMSKLIFENKAPSLSCISTIIQNLMMLKNLPNIDENRKTTIDKLCNEGQNLINKKLLR